MDRTTDPGLRRVVVVKRAPLAASAMRNAVSEPAIYGVVLVAGLVVIIGNNVEASWAVLLKVLATLIVFWVAHVYAAVVAHLGDEYDEEVTARARLTTAVSHAVLHSWGMLLAAVLPLVILMLGVLRVISDQDAIWGTLWAAALVLGFLGWIGVASWTQRLPPRLLGAVITSLLGLLLVAIKMQIK